MKMDDPRIKEYEMLKHEQLKVQDRMHNLYIWGIAGMAILWGFAINNQDKVFSYLIALVPALTMPFLFLWARDLDYTGHRIAKYIKENIEPLMWGEEGGWETWVNAYRMNEEIGESPQFFNPWSRIKKDKPMHGRLGVALYNILFLLIIPLSLSLASYLAFITRKDNKLTWSFDQEKLTVIVLALLVSCGLYWYFQRVIQFNRQRLKN